MKKLIWALAASAALVPAAIGLLGNPSLGESVPVQVPSSAEVVHSVPSHSTPTPSTSTPAPSSSDDHGGQRSGSDDPSGDDRGGQGSGSDDPSGDDHGGQRSGSDDTPNTAPSSSDDHGGSGHGGSGSGGSGRGGSDDSQPHH